MQYHVIPRDSISPLDIVVLFRHSKHGDNELLFSLRSIAKHLPFIRKVWIVGDRPELLSSDEAGIEHVAHEYIAPLLGFRTPVRNDFLMLFLASLIPELSFHFVRFSDDYILLRPLTLEQLCTVRALEDLNVVGSRGRDKWKDMLWRTFDILKQHGFPGYNFESHVPQPLDRRLVFEAFMAFRPFLSEERYAGMHSATAIYNYAIAHHDLKFVWIKDEKSKVGFYGKCPSKADIPKACDGKLFLNFDDAAFGPPMLEYLQDLFPEPCKYERQ